MKWETKDKLQKLFIVILIISFSAIILWGYQSCQRKVVEEVFFGGVKSMSQGICNKLSSENCLHFAEVEK